MPDVPKKVTIDRKRRQVLIDGVEFPWMIDKRGPEIEGVASADSIPIVTIPIFASDVEVIPECVDCDELDDLGVDYETIVDGLGQHRRHIPDVAGAQQRVRDAETALADARSTLARTQGSTDV